MQTSTIHHTQHCAVIGQAIRRALAACGGLALGSAATLATAQSPNVTLYGLLDVSMAYFDSQYTSDLHMLDGTSYGPGSRWGLRVNEDLGSGVKVGAVLEGGFLTTTGQAAQGGLLFGRQVFLSVRSEDVGELRLGRQYILHDWAMSEMNPTGSITVVNPSIGYTLVSTGNWVAPMLTAPRVNQSLQYISPRFGGFQMQLMHAFKQNVQDGYSGVKLNFAAGALNMTAVYEQSDALDSSVRPSSSVNKVVMAGGSYDFDVVKLFAGYQRIRDLSQAATTTHIGGMNLNLPRLTGVATKMDAYSFGASAPMGAQTTVFANYVHTRYADAVGRKVSIANYGAGASYALSRRTTVYGAVALAGGDLKNDVLEKRIVQLGLRHAF